MEAKLSLFERPGGLATSNTNTGLQWDEPYGWAPTNWIAVAGLEAYRISRRCSADCDSILMRRSMRDLPPTAPSAKSTTWLKGNAQVNVSAGYTQNVIGFGWTNAVYLKLKEITDRAAPATAHP